jgi:CRISPR-associated protein Csm5
MESKLEQCRVNLHILSPIHIGTGQELDPFSYIIIDNNLLLVDLVKWMNAYPDQDELSSMVDSNNFAEMRSFIADKMVNGNEALASIPVKTMNLLSTYRRVIKEKDPRNQLLIDGMTRNKISQAPYIPGSSIKGSIRTAIANHFVEAAKVTSKNKRKEYKPVFEPDYNEKIFGSIKNDPMKNMKFSDIPLDKFGSLIIEAEEYPLNEGKTKTPKGFKEVSANFCQDGNPVIYPLRFSLKPFSLLGQNVNLGFIVEVLYRFYVSKYKEEYQKFFTSNRAKAIQQEIAPMSVEIANLKTNETLIRIGHFSHVECITLDNVRDPKTRSVKGRPMPYGTTRTLANGLYPFGWAKLEFLDIESKPRSENDWPFSIEDVEGLAKMKYANFNNIESATNQIPHMKEEVKRVDNFIAEIKRLKPTDAGPIGNKIDLALKSLETDEEKRQFALAVKEHMGKGFKKSKAKIKLVVFFGE